MELRSGDKSERELVEEYIGKFALTEMLDEVLNALLEERPENPYTTLSKMIETKTMPEIIDVKVYPIVVEGGCGGVEAKVVTNLGEFIGSAGDLFDAPAGSGIRAHLTTRTHPHTYVYAYINKYIHA
jgi:hypothetical protein